MIEAKKKFKETKNKDDEKLISRYHNLQLAKKIQLNSAYGALGNQYFRWFNFNHAEAITTSGQLSIKWIEQKINAYFNKLLKTENTDYVIASDTDSVYVNMGPLVEKLDMTDDLEIVKALDAFCEQKIQPYINKSYQELGDVMSVYQQKMQMKRENISNKGIWKAKKMYILNVWNSEGVQYEKPELKIMGIEAVRSSTPASCRENIKKTLDLIMNSDQKTVLSFIEEFREKFFQMEFEEVAFPRGVKLIFFRKNDNGNAFPMHYKLDQKSLPIQVRASLLYNKVIKDANLEKKHQPITNGDKIKFAYLITPNPITRQENVIATNSAMPKQLEINKYIDYEKQFDKAFLDPIKSILDVLHWKVNNKKVSTLEDWFV
jgi:DNA polymerase elongation subunit (family B)